MTPIANALAAILVLLIILAVYSFYSEWQLVQRSLYIVNLTFGGILQAAKPMVVISGYTAGPRAHFDVTKLVGKSITLNSKSGMIKGKILEGVVSKGKPGAPVGTVTIAFAPNNVNTKYTLATGDCATIIV
jgi:hypothetical protein